MFKCRAETELALPGAAPEMAGVAARAGIPAEGRDSEQVVARVSVK